VRAPGGGPEALRTPSLAHKLKGGDRMEPQQARKAADTARSGQIGPKRPFPHFSGAYGKRALCKKQIGGEGRLREEEEEGKRV
jgi:hypothetical protein